jgi:long-chain-fatty-acid--[acyl-carrier-protein] ligase
LVLVCIQEIERAEVNRHIAEAGLSSLHNIRHVVQIDDIPILGTGKTNYRALAAQLPQLLATPVGTL